MSVGAECVYKSEQLSGLSVYGFLLPTITFKTSKTSNEGGKSQKPEIYPKLGGGGGGGGKSDHLFRPCV